MAAKPEIMDQSPLSIHLKQDFKFSDNELIKIIQLFETVHVKKNEHLYRPGEIVRQVYFEGDRLRYKAARLR